MQIATQARPMPHATLVYSPPGVGKTEFAAHYPAPIFLMVDLEIGLLTLINSGRVPSDTAFNSDPINTWDQLMNNLEWLADSQHPYKTAVIDTMNSAELLLKRKVTFEHYYNREDKFDAYAKGWDRCINPWNYFLHRLNNLRVRGMRVVCLSHSEVSQVRNPDGEDYQSHTPLLNKTKLWVPTNAFCDNVLFMNLEVCTVTDKNEQAVKDKNHRLLYVQANAGHFAKNRLSLIHPISMGTCGAEGFHNFHESIEAARPKKVPKPAAQSAPRKQETGKGQPGQDPEDVGRGPDPVPAPTGPEWVQTWRNRITAADKIGPALSIFGDILSDYSSAVEPDQQMHFPGIFNCWIEHCLKIGGRKSHDQIQKKLGGQKDLPESIMSSLTAALEASRAVSTN